MEYPSDLPHDAESLRALILEQQERIRYLEQENRTLFKMAFGRSTERRKPEGDASQGFLFAQEIAAEASRLAEQLGTTATVEVRRHARTVKKKGRRSVFPEHLPVVRTVCELPGGDQCGCGGGWKEISEEVTQELERVETMVVHEIVRKKYVGQCGTCMKTAPWRGRVIEKGLLGPGFLAHVLVERFGNHMPYYRQEKKYASEGVALSRSVLQSSTARCAELLEPIAEELKREVMASPVVHTDDTPVMIAQSGEGGPRKGRVWVYLNREGRHWYDFTRTRERDGPMRVLGEYQGYVQADAYGGYDRLYVPGGAKEVACWAHVRRKFVEAEATDETLSREAVNRIRELFRIEREADDRKLDDAARHRLRQEQAAPRVEAFRVWMEQAELQVLPRSPIAKAIGYARNQWNALTRYLEDGRLAISNNAAESALRPIAVGRNYGHPRIMRSPGTACLATGAEIAV